MKNTVSKLSRRIALGAILLFALAVPAEEAKPKPIRVLLVTGGHPFDEEGFFAVFKSHADLDVRHVTHEKEAAKDANREFSEEKAKSYDVIVLYDLWQEISKESREDLVKLLEGGKGLVVLHHAMADYQGWPEFRKIAGGRFCLAPLAEEGKSFPQSTATGVQKMKVKVEDREHPITKGLEDFEIEEEPYGKLVVEPGVRVLLTTDCPASEKSIAWCHSYAKARVATIQLGHDRRAYENPAYRKVVGQAIRWVAGRIGEAPAGKK